MSGPKAKIRQHLARDSNENAQSSVGRRIHDGGSVLLRIVLDQRSGVASMISCISACTHLIWEISSIYIRQGNVQVWIADSSNMPAAWRSITAARYTHRRKEGLLLQYFPISRTSFKVSDFLQWQESGGLELSPSFQRRPVWPILAKSYLLDTLIRGLPVPIIFIREKTDLRSLRSVREVVDGQQRLRTLLGFIKPSSLPDFDPQRDAFTIKKVHNEELAGKSFLVMPADIQMRLLDYEFSVHTLPSSVDDQQVLQIFARMNSTGVKLNPQELRNAQFLGEFKISMYSLAYEQLSRWRDWGIFDEQDIARMDEVEMTSDLANLMLNGVTGKSRKILDDLFDQFEAEFPYRTEIERRFRQIMDLIDDMIGPYLSASEFRRTTLFYSLFAFLYDLSYGLASKLVRTTPRRIDKSIPGCLRQASSAILAGNLPEELATALRGATAHAASRNVRLSFLRSACNGG